MNHVTHNDYANHIAELRINGSTTNFEDITPMTVADVIEPQWLDEDIKNIIRRKANSLRLFAETNGYIVSGDLKFFKP